MSEVVDGQALEVYDAPQSVTLFHSDDPNEVVKRAAETADALARVVRDPKRGLISHISGREFPKVEAWTLLGTMLGVYPVCVWSRPLENGWEARVEAHTRDGAVIGAAEAQCTRDEKEWGPKPTRGKPKDDYALRSMAQTRATSKALRLPLGFVMSLAGLEVTPAEEMPGEARSAPPNGGPVSALLLDVQAGIERLGPTDRRWTLAAVLGNAAVRFGRPVAFLDELTEDELAQILAAMPGEES